jgi:hypothetical protein
MREEVRAWREFCKGGGREGEAWWVIRLRWSCAGCHDWGACGWGIFKRGVEEIDVRLCSLVRDEVTNFSSMFGSYRVGWYSNYKHTQT